MSTILFLTLANIIFCFMAQLNVWRPMSFSSFQIVNIWYCKIILYPWVILIVVNRIRQNNLIPPTEAEISEIIYTKDYSTMIKRELKINFLALLAWQNLITLLLLIF